VSAETEVLWLDEHPVVSLSELIDLSGLREAELLELVQSGALQVRDVAGGYSFSARMITVARTASRLRDDLELDTQALSVALKLLERVRDLETEIARLRALLPRS
jgi:isopentenyl diphosphate isomerase/L-lactate dehydrogenase-like FMN-dependent dehydrogenase